MWYHYNQKKGCERMPKKCKHPCSYPGCPNLTDSRYCKIHKQPDRPSAAKRGYNSKWRRLSKQYLRKHPMCVRCLQQGRYVPATVVDHIIPHRGNLALMWDESNWQALCKPCHDKKTWTEDKNPVYTYWKAPGLYKPLTIVKTLTGGPSHARKRVFKRPIDPSDIKILKNTDNF